MSSNNEIAQKIEDEKAQGMSVKNALKHFKPRLKNMTKTNLMKMVTELSINLQASNLVILKLEKELDETLSLNDNVSSDAANGK